MLMTDGCTPLEIDMVVELKHVLRNFSQPGGNTEINVLKDITLMVKRGESVAIIGPSGSGKSTLLNIMGGLDRPCSGTVRLNGKELSCLTDRELSAVRNREIGFIFQMHHLLPQCTVLENVLVPTIPLKDRSDKEAAIERAGALLKIVGLSLHKDHRPGQLSGGECQRVAVVRALINQPGLVLADEPTGSLDRAAADNLTRLLVELNKKEEVTLVVVTHSLELAKGMDRRFRLCNGTLTPIE